MKLFQLKVDNDIAINISKHPQCRGYFFWFTDTTEYTVLAESEQQARYLCSNGSCEAELKDKAHWLVPALTICKEIPMDKARIIADQTGTG